MSDVYNLDICPECDSELQVGGEFSDLENEPPDPVQGYWLMCDECGHETVLAILHYPDGEYEGISEAVAEECQDCDDDAEWRVKRNTGREKFWCDDHVLELFSKCYKEAAIRLHKMRP